MLNEIYAYQKQTKNNIMPLKYFILILSFFTPFLVYSQRENCKHIFVWDFTDENGKYSSYSRLITEEVEDLLTGIEECIILQRRNYASLLTFMENEKMIAESENIPIYLADSLKTISAQSVVLGMVETDFNFNIKLRIRVENIYTKAIKSESILFSNSEFVNIEIRSNKLREILSNLFSLNSVALDNSFLLKFPFDVKFGKTTKKDLIEYGFKVEPGFRNERCLNYITEAMWLKKEDLVFWVDNNNKLDFLIIRKPSKLWKEKGIYELMKLKTFYELLIKNNWTYHSKDQNYATVVKLEIGKYH